MTNCPRISVGFRCGRVREAVPLIAAMAHQDASGPVFPNAAPNLAGFGRPEAVRDPAVPRGTALQRCVARRRSSSRRGPKVGTPRV